MLRTLSHSLVPLPPPPPPPSRQLVVAIAVAVAVAVAVAAPALSLPLLLESTLTWLDTRRIRGSLHARGGLDLRTVELVATATTFPATKAETDGQERASLMCRFSISYIFPINLIRPPSILMYDAHDLRRCSELLNDFHVLRTLKGHMKTSKKSMILF
ncbi:hypothetical protein R3P38DRAFT_3096213 [Favolaschia claudopus]|uniref:Uncharacterized protein n=1 Tax=Favolaschia claudopus TaxID=2862362 RepID=A0AAV9ZQS8_9AGAR